MKASRGPEMIKRCYRSNPGPSLIQRGISVRWPNLGAAHTYLEFALSMMFNNLGATVWNENLWYLNYDIFILGNDRHYWAYFMGHCRGFLLSWSTTVKLFSTLCPSCCSQQFWTEAVLHSGASSHLTYLLTVCIIMVTEADMMVNRISGCTMWVVVLLFMDRLTLSW